MRRLLLVDDNDKYAELLTTHFAALGYTIDRAVTGNDGVAKVEEHGIGYYPVLVTDITMESQLAGVTMLGRLQKMGYVGTIVVASTGFDVPLGLPLSRLILRRYGVRYLIPKTSVLKKEPLFYPIKLGSKASQTFTEAEAPS
ncbi:MAG: response regulator [Spirochaetia bacterium]|nr:response regulator [Spirochaetia bacterium]